MDNLIEHINLDDGFATPEDAEQFAVIFGKYSRYCTAKALSMRCRLRGDISMAAKHERTMQAIYDTLPNNFRW